MPPQEQTQAQNQADATPAQPTQTLSTTTSQTTTNNSYDITLNQILNSNGFSNGVMHGTQKDGTGASSETDIIKDKIAFGDLDGDGYTEAVVPMLWCWASCGQLISVYENDHGKIISAELPEAKDTSEKQHIISITITNGIISVSKSDWFNAPAGMHTYQVKFVNGDLRALDPATGNYVSRNVKNANFSFLSPTGAEIFKVGTTVHIRWSATGLAPDVSSTLSIDNEKDQGSIVGETTNTGSFDWVVPSFFHSFIDNPSNPPIPWTNMKDSVYRFTIDFGYPALGGGYSSNKFSIVQ